MIELLFWGMFAWVFRAKRVSKTHSTFSPLLTPTVCFFPPSPPPKKKTTKTPRPMKHLKPSGSQLWSCSGRPERPAYDAVFWCEEKCSKLPPGPPNYRWFLVVFGVFKSFQIPPVGGYWHSFTGLCKSKSSSLNRKDSFQQL